MAGSKRQTRCVAFGWAAEGGPVAPFRLNPRPAARGDGRFRRGHVECATGGNQFCVGCRGRKAEFSDGGRPTDSGIILAATNRPPGDGTPAGFKIKWGWVYERLVSLNAHCCLNGLSSNQLRQQSVDHNDVLPSALALAQRFLAAAAIFARASGDMRRRLVLGGSAAR